MELHLIETWATKKSALQTSNVPSVEDAMKSIRVSCNEKITAGDFENVWEIIEFIEWELSQRWVIITSRVRTEINFLILEFRGN